MKASCLGEDSITIHETRQHCWNKSAGRDFTLTTFLRQYPLRLHADRMLPPLLRVFTT
jgi:hypothetical protein